MENKEYVPNDVYRFRIYPTVEIDDITVYIDEGAFNKDENKVLEAYFTPERKSEILLKYIKKLLNTPNAIEIYCTDLDGGYKVTKEQIFKEQ